MGGTLNTSGRDSGFWLVRCSKSRPSTLSGPCLYLKQFWGLKGCRKVLDDPEGLDELVQVCLIRMETKLWSAVNLQGWNWAPPLEQCSSKQLLGSGNLSTLVLIAVYRCPFERIGTTQNKRLSHISAPAPQPLFYPLFQHPWSERRRAWQHFVTHPGVGTRSSTQTWAGDLWCDL